MFDLYNKMYNSGAFDPSSENYFWVEQMEWLSQNDNAKYRALVGENIVPIAKNSGGDIWGIVNHNGSIVLCNHEDQDVSYYADSLENAIFKAIVEYLSDNNFDTESSDDKDEYTEYFARKYIKKCAEIFKDVFSVEQNLELKRISENGIKEYSDGNYTHKSFLSNEEAKKILRKYIPENKQKDNYISKIIDDRMSVRERTPFFESDYYDLSEHCFKRSKEYYYSHDNLLHKAKAVKNMRIECYTKALDDIYFPHLSTALKKGRKNGTLIDEDSFTDGIKYYINESDNKPVYSEFFISGKLAKRTFYFFECSESYAISFSVSLINGKIQFDEISETRFNLSGKIESEISYNDSRINWYNIYYYKNEQLDKCESFNWFDCSKAVSYITDKVTDDGMYYGDKNPMLVQIENYIFEKGKISEIETWVCNLEKVSVSKAKAKATEYKKLQKNKFI